MRIHAQQLFTPAGVLRDRIITIDDGTIVSVVPGTDAPVSCPILTPGLIDVHIHGGEGFNARDFDLRTIAPFLDKLLSCGVTDFLMTISTGRREVMRHGLEVTRRAMDMQREGTLGGARILGAHLEGPFLSTQRAGAMQLDMIIPPSAETYDSFFAGYEDIIRLVTLAPEEEGAHDLIRHLRQKSVCVQSGHTYATYDQAQAGFAAGSTSLCHSFNACRGIHHREPGVVLAALTNPDVYAEAICDFEHLHPAVLEMIYRMKGPDRMILISDSVATHGLADGEYFMEGYHIVVKDGVSRTFDGALDGGGAYLDQAVRNMQKIGISSENAVRMATQTPAERLGLCDLGVLAPGMRAHLTAWNDAFTPIFTVLEDGIHR
ncbi:MAG: N-acetylglucosamine-6-phosphate deacetylase [Clostridia bacterium]|nr:N-acetylglucosamine-6-phosphate deacetylase [Clostridia bacterium]